MFFSEDILQILISTAVLTGTYWAVSLFYLLVDLKNKPAYIHSKKIRDTRIPWKKVDKKQLTLVVINVLQNQLLVAPLILFACLEFKHWLWGSNISINPFPSCLSIIMQIFCFILIEEIGLYYCHRMLHHRAIYKYIHKAHHEWVIPVGLISVYCHPLEHILNNCLFIFLGPALLNSHLMTNLIWFSLSAFYGVNMHAGYDIPFVPSPQAHEFHHKKVNEMFGILGIMDYIHGTDQGYRKSIDYKPNLMMRICNQLTLGIEYVRQKNIKAAN